MGLIFNVIFPVYEIFLVYYYAKYNMHLTYFFLQFLMNRNIPFLDM